MLPVLVAGLGCGSGAAQPAAIAYADSVPKQLSESSATQPEEVTQIADSAEAAPSTTAETAGTEPSAAPVAARSVQDRRTTSEGIDVWAEPDVADFGNGPQEVVWVRGERGAASAGVTVDPEFVEGDIPQSVDMLGWASSADIFVVLFKAAPDITEIRVVTTGGAVDVTTPDGDGLAVLGVIEPDLGNVRAQALDADGHVLATCALGDVFFECVN